MFWGKKSDNSFFYDTSAEFVPVVCHYDENTLLTRNGELVQIIQINGINADEINENLFNLREVVREAISESINDTNKEKVAFWVHTIRRKANLDDVTDYDSFLSGNIHNIWRIKNFWHDKFVNRLYITIVHSAALLKLKNFNSFTNSFSINTIRDFEKKYLEKAFSQLDELSNNMLEKLKNYGAQKLGIKFEDEECYSEPIFLYGRIMQLNEKKCKVPIYDISETLSSCKYAVGVDKLEVISEETKKFAAVISIKEYHEVSAESLDKFLQIPVEMIATEVFYFVKKDEVLPKFKEQNKILNISKDQDLREIKGLKTFFDTDDKDIKFCHQQISFMVIGDDIDMLERQLLQASNSLSQVGIVHVREDIDLEKSFWAQLPGNFSFLSRMNYNTLNDTAALASLHNFPTGEIRNPWGRAVTLLRTERGTPFFFNFHDDSGRGQTCIFAEDGAGKTVLMNFLLSEANKYLPTVLYITDDTDSIVYINAQGGEWLEKDKQIINPLICQNSPQNRNYLIDFFQIIMKHFFDPLNDQQLKSLENLVDKILAMPVEERKLSLVNSFIDQSDPSKDEILNRLKPFLEGGEYYKVFEPESNIELLPDELLAVNLQFFDDAAYTKEHYPKEKKLISQFEYNLNFMRSVKMGIVLALQNMLQNVGTNSPKMLAIDNLSKILNIDLFSSYIEKMSENISSVNGAMVFTFDIMDIHKHENNDKLSWVNNLNTTIIVPTEIPLSEIKAVLSLDKIEFEKLSSLSISSRMFLIKQNNKTIAVELSIGGLQGVLRILSSGKNEIKAYEEIIREIDKENVEEWVSLLYEELSNI